MPDITINGRAFHTSPGSTVAAAVLNSGVVSFRRSVSGRPRGPLCGMGICYECRLTIDGERHARSCQVLCREGMAVETE